MEPRKMLVAYSLKYGGDFNKILRAATAMEPIEDCYEELVDSLKCQTLTLADPNYPEHLKNSFKPPIVLYYYGDITLIYNYKMSVSVVGSRECSEYGAEMTKEIVEDLQEQVEYYMTDRDTLLDEKKQLIQSIKALKMVDCLEPTTDFKEMLRESIRGADSVAGEYVTAWNTYTKLKYLWNILYPNEYWDNEE